MAKMRTISCPHCRKQSEIYDNPAPVVDMIIEVGDKIVLIKRKYEPHGWALPGGFVDYGETVEAAAIRESKEETNLDITLVHLLGVYSKPERDPRSHTISTTFVAKASGAPVGGDDAAEAKLFTPDDLPAPMVFDHTAIIKDYVAWKSST